MGNRRLAYLSDNVKPRIPQSSRPYYASLESLREQCMLRCRSQRERDQVVKKKTYAALEKWLAEDGRTREGCDLSCNIHTGIRICPLALVIEDLRLRGIEQDGMSEIVLRSTLELLLREEEEYLKLQMYVSDLRFKALIDEEGHRSELHKTILDMLHCPMRTNEKVLNLLYEEVMEGAHKAEARETLNRLTVAIRRIGDLPPSFTHKFEKKNTKVLKKIKLPYDQSRKIFGIHQLHNLRELVEIVIPATNQQRREEWTSFLFHYVKVNERLHSTLKYTAEDIDELEADIDAMFCLLVKSIGGAERGVTNYFHYLGSGHIVWMIKIYGNLWRYCNECVEGFNTLASKRYNQFNNFGGNKGKRSRNAANEKLLPFEVLGNWLTRLSMWHIGTADMMFAVESTPEVVWKPDLSVYGLKSDCSSEGDIDSDWTPIDVGEESTSDDEMVLGFQLASDDDYESEDITWCSQAATMHTWEAIDLTGSKVSSRRKYQQIPFAIVRDL